jgi:hypothetical protein
MNQYLKMVTLEKIDGIVKTYRLHGKRYEVETYLGMLRRIYTEVDDGNYKKRLTWCMCKEVLSNMK